ncbi:L-ribulose-5-phosphate 3-epimerase [Actinomyces sp. zg296]|uniref:L-ribulose-5-phosphate 3-epimerase n=1 Tax=Actinomyces sp. zg296 TaxID=2609289 RepID=UPI001F1C36F3|nr:L-ribulose-5-phosphate 3-epimerase [Actinomyces sp. zg296]
MSASVLAGSASSASGSSATRPNGSPRADDPLAEGLSLGIYEKALRGPAPVTPPQWRDFLAQVAQGGFSFLDLSIDESPEREARLDWSPEQWRAVRRAAEDAGVMIGGICLSIHRRIAPGSADPATRQRAREVMAQGLHACHEVGAPVLQIAGYYCFYEEPGPDSARWYADLLVESVPLAARLGVVMGIENVDGVGVTSITRAMELVEEIDSPFLQVYPDLGNIAEQGLDPRVEIPAGRGHMVAMHAKDVRRGEPRRVEMGTGIVDWDLSFSLLADQGWAGRLMIEMWNDDAPDSVARCVAARSFIEERARAAGIAIVGPESP